MAHGPPEAARRTAPWENHACSNGLRPELLPHVFDLYVQAETGRERAQGGLGIGLSIASGLVRLHGGTLTAHSDGLGRGSEFVIRLPPSTASAAPITEAHAAARPSPAAPRRILVVDDNRDSVDMLAEVFRSLGHTVQTALDGEAALEIAEGFAPEVAFLDIGLPTMDGYELAGRLRALLPPGGLRLVALTGYGQETDTERARRAGFDEHLVKPVDISRLGALVDRLVTHAGAGTPSGGDR